MNEAVKYISKVNIRIIFAAINYRTLNGKLRDRGGCGGWQVITFRCQKLKKRHNRQTYSTRFVHHNGGITIHRYGMGDKVV